MDEKKISLPETLIMVFIIFFAELYELGVSFFNAVPVIGQVIAMTGFFASFVTWLSIQLWFIMKEIRGVLFLVVGILDMIANLLLLDLPFFKTIAVIITVYLANHPKALALATKVHSLTTKEKT